MAAEHKTIQAKYTVLIENFTTLKPGKVISSIITDVAKIEISNNKTFEFLQKLGIPYSKAINPKNTISM